MLCLSWRKTALQRPLTHSHTAIIIDYPIWIMLLRHNYVNVARLALSLIRLWKNILVRLPLHKTLNLVKSTCIFPHVWIFHVRKHVFHVLAQKQGQLIFVDVSCIQNMSALARASADWFALLQHVVLTHFWEHICPTLYLSKSIQVTQMVSPRQQSRYPWCDIDILFFISAHDFEDELQTRSDFCHAS